MKPQRKPSPQGQRPPERLRLIGRRELLRKVAGAAGVAAGAGLVLAACDDSGDKLECTNTAGLTGPEIATRTTVSYVDDSPHPDKLCSNCRFFQSKGDKQCGGCTLVKGPIHPDGYCNSWVLKDGAPQKAG